MSKLNSSKSDDDKITEALNQSGTFLQIFTATLLEKNGWKVSPEYPVTIAPFVMDPIHDPEMEREGLDPSYITYLKAFTRSRNLQLQEETAIDIIASKEFGDYLFTFCIEVKKRNPKYVKWIFVQEHEHYERTKAPLIFYDRAEIGDVLLCIPRTRAISNELFVRLNEEYTGRFPDFTIFDYVRAMRRKNKDELELEQQFYDAEQTDIDKACRQILKGTYGLILDRLTEILSSGQAYPNKRQILVPIVVTNAELLSCEYDKLAISNDMGYLDKSPEYKPLEKAVYDCSLPNTARFPLDMGSLDVDKRRFLLKWHVYIMTPKGLQDFLAYMNNTW